MAFRKLNSASVFRKKDGERGQKVYLLGLLLELASHLKII
jgi:hypothetical protein